MNRALAVLALALAGAAGEGARAQTAAWPEFRGPGRNGIVAGTLPLRWSEEENVRWKTAVPGRGWSTPVVIGSRIWLSTADEKGHVLSALEIDAESGKVLREMVLFEIEAPQPRNALNSYASPSPVTDGERVYFSFGAHGTVCIDAQSGKRVWERTDLVCDHMEGPGSSPLLADGLLTLLFDGGDVQFVVALDARSGETRWKKDRGVDYGELSNEVRKAFSTPILIERGGATELVASCARATIAYAPKTGEELWRIAHPGFSMASKPVYADGVIYFTTAFMSPEWWAVRCGPAPAEGDDDRVLWRLRGRPTTMPSPILHQGLLYLSDDRGKLSCVDAKSGQELWHERKLGSVCASPILSGDRLLFCDREGLSVVLAAGKEFVVLAENHLDAGCYASPILIGKALFLRTSSHLYRIEEP